MQFMIAINCTYFGFRGGGPATPDGKLALVTLNMLRDAHVARLKTVSQIPALTAVLSSLPSSSSYTGIWLSHSSLSLPWRRRGRARTGTFSFLCFA